MRPLKKATRSKKDHNFFPFVSLLLLGLFSTAPFLQAIEDKTPASSLENQVLEMERRLNEIDKNQQLLLKKQDEILEKLDSVKIWSRRY